MNTMTRRQWLRSVAVLGMTGAMQALWKPWMPRVAFASQDGFGDTLVVIFLRGGADALNMVVPYGDSNYYAARPTLALARPDERKASHVLRLDDFFGLNPDMSALHELFMGGRMTALHACGAPNISRSHFEAMDLLERGTDGASGADSGWLGRHLSSTAGPQDSPLRAIGWDEKLPKSLYGYVSASALRSIAEFHLHTDSGELDQMSLALAELYQNTGAPLESAALATLDALETIRQLDIENYRPSGGAVYSENDFGRAMMQTAALIKAEVGLEVACIDHGNYDTHITQGVTIHGGVGAFPNLVHEFAENLRAFHDDLLNHMHRVTVVVMSEFGRRVQENGAGGTDHGHGGAMYLLSEHLNAAPVVAAWPGLNPDFLANGDLEIATDYRDVLSEVLLRRASRTDLAQVFPEHVHKPLGLFKPA